MAFRWLPWREGLRAEQTEQEQPHAGTTIREVGFVVALAVLFASKRAVLVSCFANTHSPRGARTSARAGACASACVLVSGCAWCFSCSLTHRGVRASRSRWDWVGELLRLGKVVTFAFVVYSRPGIRGCTPIVRIKPIRVLMFLCCVSRGCSCPPFLVQLCAGCFRKSRK